MSEGDESAQCAMISQKVLKCSKVSPVKKMATYQTMLILNYRDHKIMISVSR